MCIMRALVAICVCTVLLVTGNSALPYSTTDYKAYLKARSTQEFLRGEIMQDNRNNECMLRGNKTRLRDRSDAACSSTDQVEPHCPDRFEDQAIINNFQVKSSENILEINCRTTTDSNIQISCCDGNTLVVEIDQVLRRPSGGSTLLNYNCPNAQSGFTDAIARQGSPTCIMNCQRDLSLKFGEVTYKSPHSRDYDDKNTSQVDSIAQFECKGGYRLSEEKNLTCEINQDTKTSEWDGEPPLCELIECPQDLSGGPNFDDVVYNSQSGMSTPGSTATFICQPGYKQVPESPPDIVVCQEDGTWDRRQPSSLCQQICNQDLTVVNGVAIYSVTPSTEDSTATFRCNDGFEPAMTFPDNVCQFSEDEGGLVWTGRFPICVGPCPDLNIVNGDVTYSRTPHGLGSTASFECDETHDLEGEDSLTCIYDENSMRSRWSGNPPTCTPKPCQQNLNIVNGDVTYSTTPSIPGTTATYACNGDNELHGGDTRRVCRFNQAEGRPVWSGVPPICVAPCPNLNIDNGDVTYSRTPHGLGSTASFECDETHNLEGEDSLTCVYDENSMRSRWSGNPPTCTIKPCQQNLNIVNGDVTYSATPSIPGTTATYACNGDNELHGGDTRRVCRFNQAEGRPVWSGVPPICVAPCPQNLNIVNGDVTYTRTPSRLGSTANFVCDDNHDLTGEDSLTCEFDPTSMTARWSGNPPTCTPEGCPLLTDRPINGNIKYTPASVASTLPVGTTATYECGGNFIPVPSNFIRTCQRDGTWSGGPVTVTCQTACPRLSGTIQNGFIQPPSNRDVILNGAGVILGWRVNSVARYNCNPGFELVTKNGIKARICQRDGTWTPITAFCRAISTECPRLGKNVALGDDNRYTKQKDTLIKAGYGTKTTEPFATRTEFTGYQEGDRYTLTCVNGWNPLSGSGFEVCQRNESTGLMEWSRTNVCFFRYAGGSLNAQPIRE